jgi:enoyl-CoA hydratase
MSKAMSIALKIAGNGPLAVQRVKQTVTRVSGMPLAEGYGLEDASKRIVMASEDAREGPRAFMEKRSPRFTGR